MNWETTLHSLLLVLGDQPSKEQLGLLSRWIKRNVPPARWGDVAIYLPYELMTDFRMYAAEMGEI